MKRWSWGASALGTLLVAVGTAIAAQKPRQDQTQEPRTADQPQMKAVRSGSSRCIAIFKMTAIG
jgi:hypothetical protein